MNQPELYTEVKTLWLQTTEPLTNQRIANATGLSHQEVEHAMRGLLRAGAVDLDVSDEGDVCWKVPGVERKAQLVQSRPAVRSVARSSTISVPGVGLQVSVEQDPNKKSVLLSGGMGLLFGPFGWGYAGPWAETIAAVGLYVLVALVMPRFLLGTFFGIVHPMCGVLAMLHAFRFNQAGVRTPLLYPRGKT